MTPFWCRRHSELLSNRLLANAAIRFAWRQSVFLTFPDKQQHRKQTSGPRLSTQVGQQCGGGAARTPWNINDVAELQFTREHLFPNYTPTLSSAVGSPLNQELNVSTKLLLFMLNICVPALFSPFILFFAAGDRVFVRSRLACDFWH